MSVKSKMIDEERAMDGWDIFSVDPCTWSMVSCSSDGFVKSLYRLFSFYFFIYVYYLIFSIKPRWCGGTVDLLLG